jgi:hypothetical protein
MRIRLLVLVIFFVQASAFGQVISGKVIDSLKKEPIAFVNIALDDGIHGTTSDIEGNFKLHVPPDYEGFIHLSHISYKKVRLSLYYFSNHRLIPLVPKVTVLSEVIFTAEENPAFRIIRNAVKNKDQNDPNRLSSYEYHSYNKFIIKPSQSSENFKDKIGKLRERSDSTKHTKKEKELLSFDSLVSKMHFFMSESVTEKKVMNPGRSNEKLIGFRSSGFKSPLFANVATDYQPFSFYKDNISLLGKDFLNPISRNSEARYNFYLTDTTYHQGDTVYVIQFEPKKGKLITGLKGMVSISTDGYAIKNIIAAMADTLSLTGIRIQQNYEKVNGTWFPVQLNTDIDFFELKFPGSHIMAQHRSFISDIKINPPLLKSSFGDIKVDLTPPTPSLNTSTLEKFRTSKLDTKEQNTYVTIDSVMKKYAWIDKTIDALATQAVPLGPLEMDLTKIVRFNVYEGMRLGTGIYTSNRFSKWIRVGGYGAYGFKDKAWKYGSEVRFNLNPNKDFFINVSYIKDIYETGYSHISQRNPMLANGQLRRLLSSRYDRIESYKGEIAYRLIPLVHASVFVSKSEIQPTYDYSLTIDNESLKIFTIAESGITLRYAGENYMQFSGKKVLLGREWPMISFSYAKASDLFGPQKFNYSRYDFSARFQFKHRPKGKTRISIHAGYVDGIAPYGKLYNGRGAQDVRGIFVDEYFQTMKLYEFTASKYASLFFNHNFGNVLYDKRYSKPEWLIYQNMGIGQLDHPEAHVSSTLTFQSFEKGFIESGTGFNNLVRWKYANVAYYGLGAAVFYRYGAYQFDQMEKNLFIRLTFSINF